MRRSILLFILPLVAISCTVEPEKIEYGKEACHFCKMTIVDNQHAAEIVTTKGKVYKYDAIECMINDLKQKEGGTVALYMVNDYAKPGTLIKAENAHFLISEAIKSPMGAFLSAFGSQKEAMNALEKNGGNLYNWDTIKDQIN